MVKLEIFPLLIVALIIYKKLTILKLFMLNADLSVILFNLLEFHDHLK